MGMEINLRNIIEFTSNNIELVAWILFVIIIIVWVLARVVCREFMPYEPIQNIFTASERKFYWALHEAIGDDFLIFAKVRIADVIKVKKGLSRKDFGRAFPKISSKHLDYVLCCPDTLRIKGAIELDDKSHQRKDRIERDRFVNRALEVAGLPLFRFPVEKEYDRKMLRKQIVKN